MATHQFSIKTSRSQNIFTNSPFIRSLRSFAHIYTWFWIWELNARSALNRYIPTEIFQDIILISCHIHTRFPPSRTYLLRESLLRLPNSRCVSHASLICDESNPTSIQARWETVVLAHPIHVCEMRNVSAILDKNCRGENALYIQEDRTLAPVMCSTCVIHIQLLQSYSPRIVC